MICLSLSDVSFEIGADLLLDRVSFSINDGTRLGIVGDNGAGKSTLLRLITGEYVPTAGAVYVAKDKRIGMLGQNQVCESALPLYEFALSVLADMSALEARVEKLRAEAETDPSAAVRYSAAQEEFARKGGYEYRSRARGTLISLGFGDADMERPVSSFSGGQKTRIALAALLLSAPDVLILDEPTNHLDADAMDWLAGCLTAYPGTVIVVSHDRWFLDETVTEVLDIEYRRARLWKGNYTAFREAKEKDRDVRRHRWECQQREIRRIEEYIAQQRRWNRERNIIAAESREKQLAKMERIERPEDPTDSIRLRFSYSGESGNEVLCVRELAAGYGDNLLFSGFSTVVRKGERVFLLGENGGGKSTLIKILAGKLRQTAGYFDWGANVQTGYYDQENQNLTPEKTVLDELWDDYPDLTQTEVRNTLALLLFKGEDVAKKVAVISGGEAARLTLAKLALKKVNVLLLDEPTNHLDISSREVLEDALLNFEGTLIAVSHDRFFIRKLATRILEFTPSGIVPFDGDFDGWKLKKKNAAADTAEDSRPSDAKIDYERKKREASERRKSAARLDRAKEAVTRIEARLAEIEAECEAKASDHVALAALWEERDRLEAELMENYEITMNGDA